MDSQNSEDCFNNIVDVLHSQRRTMNTIPEQKEGKRETMEMTTLITVMSIQVPLLLLTQYF